MRRLAGARMRAPGPCRMRQGLQTDEENCGAERCVGTLTAMRRGSLIIVLALLVLSPGASARGLAPLPCPPLGAKLIASDREVRVYRSPLGSSTVIACVVAHRTRMTLLAPPPQSGQHVHLFPGSFAKIVLAGPIAAYVVGRRTGVDTSSSELVVADVSTRRILRSTPVGYSVDAGILASGRLTSLVVTSHGSVSWIEEHRRHGMSSSVSVFAAPPIGSVITLDEGPSIAPESLTLAHGTLSWSDGATQLTAPIP